MDTKNNDSQRDFLFEIKKELGVEWDELANMAGIHSRALKTYRMPNGSNNRRSLSMLARRALERLVMEKRVQKVQSEKKDRSAYYFDLPKNNKKEIELRIEHEDVFLELMPKEWSIKAISAKVVCVSRDASNGGGWVTVDFNQRIFSLGAGVPMSGQGEVGFYKNRNWEFRMICDAINFLRSAHGEGF